MVSDKGSEFLETARELLEIESKAIAACADRLGDEFSKAVSLIDAAHSNSKKLVFMGVGKSHYVAAKLAASFMSTGVTAIFMHPSEALHGDLGALKEGDLVVLISKSGTSAELLSLLPWFKNKIKTIAITGNIHSPLSKECECNLDASVEREACPMNLLPTASTTVTLALGDALVATYAKHRNFNKENFAVFHPGGSLGKRLHKKISEIVLPTNAIAMGDASLKIKDAASLMGLFPNGAFCVVDSNNLLKGIVTDGDVRRSIARGESVDSPVHTIMNKNFISLNSDLLIEEGLALMETPTKKVYCAPVVNSSGTLLGLVRVHDML